MPVSPHLRPRESLLGLVALVTTITFGCGKAEQIRSYSAPKETKPVAKAAAPVASPGVPTDRMLTAILPAMVKAGDQIWFIKLKGERSVVAAQEDAFKNFLTSVRFAADGGATDGHK